MKKMTEQHLINAFGGESQVPINRHFMASLIAAISPCVQ